MNKLVKFFVLSLLLGLQCCKENDIVSYPITYSNAPITDYSFKAFTTNGEITDSIKVNYLVKKYDYLLTGMNNYNSEGNFIITYLSSENVEIRKMHADNPYTLTIHKKTDLIYWEKKDTISSFISYNKTFKYKPLYYEEFAIPLSSGYSKIVKYKQCYYVKTDGENLILPMLDLLYIIDTHAHIPGIDINNEFCKDSVSVIGINDTLIIKGYSLKLKKQSFDPN